MTALISGTDEYTTMVIVCFIHKFCSVSNNQKLIDLKKTT